MTGQGEPERVVFRHPVTGEQVGSYILGEPLSLQGADCGRDGCVNAHNPNHYHCARCWSPDETSMLGHELGCPPDAVPIPSVTGPQLAAACRFAEMLVDPRDVFSVRESGPGEITVRVRAQPAEPDSGTIVIRGVRAPHDLPPCHDGDSAAGPPR